MSEAPGDDPRCPECGEPVSATADYCMHCYADLDWGADASADAAGGAGGTASETGQSAPGGAATAAGAGDAAADDRVLDPDGVVDNTLTAVVGVVGGALVGVLGTAVLLFVTESVLAFPLGFVAWLSATVHLATRPTVQDAVARAGYGVAGVLLLTPLVALGPSFEGTLAERVVFFVLVLGAAAVPAGLAAGVGLVASQFVAED